MHTQNRTIPGLVWMLAGLTALGPLAIDAYLPAFPDMAADLNVSVQSIELTVSLFLAGFALGQLAGGPFSDHYGRRAAIFTGLTLFGIGTLGILLSPQVETVWVARFIQAFGGGVSVVNSAAIVRDLFRGADSARAMSRIAAIMMVAPMLAPVLGSVMLHLGSWRSIFLVLLVYTLTLLLTLAYKMPETRQVPDLPAISPLRRYLQVIRHRRALGFLVAVAFSHAAMFAFITGSSGVYMAHFGASAATFPLLFGANVVVLLICNQINIRIVHRFTPQRLLMLAQWTQGLIGCSLLSIIWLGEIQLWQLVPGIMLFIGLQGFIISNGMASTIEFFPQSAATATAMVGATGFALGGLSGALIGLLGDGSPLPMIAVMTGSVLVGITLRTLLHRNQATTTDTR
ncbi:MAG: multidrug effflux MFS transporter [Nitrincola lacisaponensis]|uniref:Bcr/CflA family efflux transporter n=1 Tax=Nitrincola lacisaponensis TaxID=267850 RepID=A0A063Y6A6_9GAMM|nr:multidrug effflux MFS transporter [Nitrincola lacisaponensis]KDE41234.1 Multidrug resistance transporter, Bcr/CflA family [Nitrincola lacisaponensis]